MIRRESSLQNTDSEELTNQGPIVTTMGFSLMERRPNTIGRLVGYHGCDLSVGQKILCHQEELKASGNLHDWLGDGAYFWVDSPDRAMKWAEDQKILNSEKIQIPAVIGAFIHLGLCLNLTDYGTMEIVKEAHRRLEALYEQAGEPLPVNKVNIDGFYLKRLLDCAVVDMIHFLRAEAEKDEYDTVLGIFEEGAPAYQGAGFREKTHIQIAVRNAESIIGFFQPRGYEILRP